MHWNILGHEPAVNYLKNHANLGKTRHAYLITGPDGVGRESLAKAFVKTLNCTNLQANQEFCGECLTCRQIEEERFPDLSFLRVAEGSKDLKIDQIREMQQTLALAPYQSNYRIVIIPDFQKATMGASNALLKSLEEPPSKAILILTADAKESLLETISSRCEVLRLRPSTVEEVKEYLIEEKGIALLRAARIAHLSGGRVGTALGFDQNQELLDAYDQALTDLEYLMTSRLRERLQYVEKLQQRKAASREHFVFLISTWLTYWRDAMIRRESTQIPLVNIEHEDQILEIAKLIRPQIIERILKEHEKALGQLDANVNPRLVIENLLLHLPLVKF
ncbi:MAG TPA: DNA polymerase III subunit [Chloroflexi bacterium]|jgi:DNA polymerase-3 subunit delta'|nr:DNA polymerase III subunit [Anaerolineaceae bacterium]HHX08659.1 DNA polymerase III subunit [Chloroflexota bacterium]